MMLKFDAFEVIIIAIIDTARPSRIGKTRLKIKVQIKIFNV